MSTDEHTQAIYPIVGESVAHNARTLANIRNLSSPVLGLAAGTLALESTAGFAFFLLGTLLTSLLVYVGPARGVPGAFFGAAGAAARKGAGSSGRGGAGGGGGSGGGQGVDFGFAVEVAFGGLGIEALMGFVMSWTLAYNLVAT